MNTYPLLHGCVLSVSPGVSVSLSPEYRTDLPGRDILGGKRRKNVFRFGKIPCRVVDRDFQKLIISVNFARLRSFCRRSFYLCRQCYALGHEEYCQETSRDGLTGIPRRGIVFLSGNF